MINPVAYYPFNELLGTTAIDSIGAKNGSIINLNRLPNGNMEGDYGWADYTAPTTNERSTTVVRSGTYSRRIVVDASNKGAIGLTFNAVSGHTYRVSCYVWTVVGSTGKARIRRNSAKVDYTLTGTTTGQWELLTADVVAGSSGTDTMRLEMSGAGEAYFDDASIIDLADTANTIVGGIGATNVIGTAYQFDGVNDYVELPNNAVFSPATTGQFTVSCIIKPDVLDFSESLDMGGDEGGAVHFLGKSESSAAEWYFRMYNKTGSSRPNRISFYVFNAAGGEGIGGYFEDTLVAGQPIFLVATVDGQYVNIYKNGILRQSTDYTIDQGYAGPLTLAATASPVRIGTTSLNVSDFGFFQGTIQQVGFYNVALNPAQVVELYNNSLTSMSYQNQLNRLRIAKNVSGLAGTVSMTSRDCLNILAGKTTLESCNLSSEQAANIWAGTTGLRHQDAINAKAGTIGLSKKDAAKFISTP
jgi:hypothetical protein